MKKSLKTIGLLLMVSLLFGTCKKEVVGPAGPAGPAGAAGKDGNANVISVVKTNLTWTGTNPDHETIIQVPEITQNILDKGSVIVFYKSGTEFINLPLASVESPWIQLDYSYGLGIVKVYFTDMDTGSILTPQSSIQFKITVIAGT